MSGNVGLKGVEADIPKTAYVKRKFRTKSGSLISGVKTLEETEKIENVERILNSYYDGKIQELKNKIENYTLKMNEKILKLRDKRTSKIRKLGKISSIWSMKEYGAVAVGVEKPKGQENSMWSGRLIYFLSNGKVIRSFSAVTEEPIVEEM